MTNDFDVSLRRRLESLAASVPVSPSGDVTAVDRQPVRARSASRLAVSGLLPVLVVVVIGAVVANVLKIGPGPGDSSAGSTDAANGPIETTTRSGDYELTIRSAKARYAVDEPIEIEATLTYVGLEPSVYIAHALGAHGSAIGFGTVEAVVGNLTLGTIWATACSGTDLAKNRLSSVPFEKSGAWNGDDPFAADYAAFLQDPVLRLREGTWHVYANAQFSLNDCGNAMMDMRAELEIEVAPTASQTHGSEPEPTTAVSPDPTFNQFDGGVVDRFDTGDFQMVISSERSAYGARDQIDLSAWYMYTGSETTIGLAHFQPEMAFSIEQLDVDNPSEGWAKIYDSSCTELTLRQNELREVRIEEHNLMLVRAAVLPGGFGALLDEGVFRLPVGRWRISASVATSIGSCDDRRREDRGLQASIEIAVVSNAEAIALATVPSDDGVCMEALGFGTVKLNPRTGLGWADASSGSGDVIWPAGFSARYEDGLAVLVDPAGRIVAREGDPIRIGGGYIDDDQVWVGCELDPFDGSPANLQTASAPLDCRAGIGSHIGNLARSPDTGLGIAGLTGTVTPVRWPFGYTAREDPDRMVLFDAAGNVVAWEGASIGFTEARVDEETLTACADVGRIPALD